MDTLPAALEVATRLGLDATTPVVLRDLRTSVVHLSPAAVVARVAPVSEEAVVRRQVEVTAHLAARGAPVAPPWPDAGPFLVGDRVVTLWTLVDHDPERPLDGAAAGRALREVHDGLADFDADDLPLFPRLDEVRRILAGLDLGTAERDELAEMVGLAEVAVAGLDAPVQAVHGDAWLGNVLRTPDGPLWSDFELTCLAPRELDLACNETSVRDRGRSREDDAYLAGYGAHDADLRRRLEALELVPLTAWTFDLAAAKPEYLDLARRRLGWALAGLRPSRG